MALGLSLSRPHSLAQRAQRPWGGRTLHRPLGATASLGPLASLRRGVSWRHAVGGRMCACDLISKHQEHSRMRIPDALICDQNAFGAPKSQFPPRIVYSKSRRSLREACSCCTCGTNYRIIHRTSRGPAAHSRPFFTPTRRRTFAVRGEGLVSLLFHHCWHQHQKGASERSDSGALILIGREATGSCASVRPVAGLCAFDHGPSRR